MSIKSTIRGYADDAARAFDRAPVEVALAFVTAVFFSYDIEYGDQIDASVSFAIAAAFAMAGAWIGTLLHALGTFTQRQRWASTGAGVLAAALYLLLIPDLTYESEGWRAMLLLAAAALFVLAAPAWASLGEDPSLRLRRVNARVAQRAIGIGLYAAALYAGLALALAAIDKLFELKLEASIYAHVFVWIALVLVPWVIVGGIDEYVRPLQEEAGIGMFHQRLVVALVPLLVAVYYLILCAYAIRIAITGELPNNLVSPLVIAAGLLVAIALILFDPAPDTGASMRWLRYTPAFFVLLAPLGIWALTTRINTYGWTEFRLIRVLLLVTLLVLAVLGTIQLARRRAFALRVIPLLLGVVFLLGAVGPWSVLSIARRDQQGRLTRVLRHAKVNLNPPPDTATHTVPADDFQQISSISSYLRNNFGDSALSGVLPAAALRSVKSRSLAQYYHLRPAGPLNSARSASAYLQLAVGDAVPLPGNATAYRVEFPGLRARMTPDTLLILASGDTLAVPLQNLLAQIDPAERVGPKGRKLDPRAAQLPVFDRTGAPRGDFVILDLAMEQRKGAKSISRVLGVMTVRAR